MASFYMDINGRFVCRYKEEWRMTSKKISMQKREDEEMGGDGVVTMRHMEKIIYGAKIVYM